MGEAGKEVRPCDRAGIGVGDVDLELRDDDEQRRRRYRPAWMRKHVLIAGEIDAIRVHRPLHRHPMADREIGE